MKKFTAILICMMTVLCMVSCGGGISGDEAKATINDFFAAISSEDYAKAEALLHPERAADMEEFILTVEKDKGIDFSKGIKIEDYTGFSSAVHDSSVGGSRYELSIKTSVGEAPVDFTIEVVRNDNGYGIYNLILDT